MKAVYFDHLATPDDDFAALRLGEFDTPVPELGEVLVRIVAASINPGDMLFLQGLYPEPKIPVFPRQIAGGHAVGVIVTPGHAAPYEAGTLVAFSHDRAWAEFVALPLAYLIPLPADYPIAKAAQFMNLITAWDLVAASGVPVGGWLALTAGNAAVSAMISQFAAKRGIQVIAIVRSAAAAQGLQAVGVREVVVADEGGGLTARLREICGPDGLAGAIDCVGGPMLAEVVRALGWGRRVVIYGGFSSEPFALHNFDVLMRGAAIHSYIYRYFGAPPRPGDLALMSEIAAAARPDSFRMAVGGFHPLEDHAAAVRESLRRPQAGKRFFAPGGGIA